MTNLYSIHPSSTLVWVLVLWKLSFASLRYSCLYLWGKLKITCDQKKNRTCIVDRIISFKIATFSLKFSPIGNGGSMLL